jgi:hypothetical protein
MTLKDIVDRLERIEQMLALSDNDRADEAVRQLKRDIEAFLIRTTGTL